MFDIHFEWINVTQLELLGVTFEKRILLILFISLVLVGFLVKPIINLFTSKRYTFVFTYLFTSFIITLVAMFITFSKHDLTYLKVSVQAISLFGFCFTLYILYQLFKREEQ